MDVPTIVILLLIAVVSPYIRKLLESVYRVCLLQIRKIHEARNHRARMKKEAEQAVRDALNAWDWADFRCEEVRTEYVKAHGGPYLTVAEKIDNWNIAVTRCIEAAVLLDQIGHTDRAMTFRNNGKIATRNVSELEKQPDKGITRFALGIDEAKKREYDARRAKNNTEDVVWLG